MLHSKKLFNNLKLAAISIIALFIVAACGDDENHTLNFSGKLVEHSTCKSDKDSFLSDEIPENISQINYSYDKATNKLTLKHINVRFNCCSDSLYANISLLNDTIIIRELEAVTEPCNCTCLYDLDMLITGVEAKKYTIKITEPRKIVFDVDLNETTNGSYSITVE